MLSRNPAFGRFALLLCLVAGMLTAAVGAPSAIASTLADPVPLTLCGNAAPAQAVPITHVVLVMLENRSYKQVVGNSKLPYQNSLASQCGTGTSVFGATHTSSANYLALSAGEFPAAAAPGCGTVARCSDPSDNIYHQLDTAGLSWRSYQESMLTPCSGAGATNYKIGHNPPIFYTDLPHTECVANDVPVTDLTSQSGPWWDDLANQTLPSLSWVTPNLAHDGSGGASAADTWLQGFMSTVQASPSYQAGNTAVVVTYDEGSGLDAKTGEDCTNLGLDLPITNNTSAFQDSCHLPFFVAYPYTAAGSTDDTFFDHYSLTKTVEELFGLPYLAHAADAQTTSLGGHFGIVVPPVSPPPPDVTPPTVGVTSPAGGATVNGSVAVIATASDDVRVDHVDLAVDGNVFGTDATSPYQGVLDTTGLTDGQHALTAVATDSSGNTQTSDPVVVTVDHTLPVSACAPTPAGVTELSGNLSVESSQTGWTGVYNSSSLVQRVAVAGGSFDGLEALSIGPKPGLTGAAGVNNVSPIWVPGSPGVATVAGRTYTASAMVRASVPGMSIGLRIRERTTAGTTLNTATTVLTAPDTGWHSISNSYAAKGTGNSLNYSLYATNFAGSSQSLLADCLSLQAPTG